MRSVLPGIHPRQKSTPTYNTPTTSKQTNKQPHSAQAFPPPHTHTQTTPPTQHTKLPHGLTRLEILQHHLGDHQPLLPIPTTATPRLACHAIKVWWGRMEGWMDDVGEMSCGRVVPKKRALLLVCVAVGVHVHASNNRALLWLWLWHRGLVG